ncbi:efflux RND transporter periplasmic adaptor subunit [Piscinibacter sp.]|uniref:efflux RND transporter periplasmic adaptor subunit n=1 Tax=Piscinibacter sp. TaxID=1903157 RepID=UPI0035AED927
MKKKTWMMLAAGAAVGVALFAWAFAPRPLGVELAAASEGPFETSIEEDGKTRLRDRFVVAAPLAGTLARITLREGDAVEAGTPLASITPVLPAMLDERTRREQQLRVEITQAQTQRVAARIEGAKVGLAQARNEQQRSEQLARQGFVAPTKLESDRLSVLAAQKELEAAVEEGHVAGHEVEQARAALMAATRPGAGAGKGFAVRAPIAGRVLKVAQASEGPVALGAPLVELGDTARLEVVAELLTADALRAAPGSAVRIERWGGDGVLEGRVRLVEPAAFTKVSALGVEEQRVRVLIDLVSPAQRWASLGDGFRVGVRIVTRSLPKVLKVPVSAVFPRPEGGDAVFVVEGGRARLVPVQLGARNGQEAWIESGLAAGAQVIVYPPPATRDGLRVAPRSV